MLEPLKFEIFDLNFELAGFGPQTECWGLKITLLNGDVVLRVCYISTCPPTHTFLLIIVTCYFDIFRHDIFKNTYRWEITEICGFMPQSKFETDLLILFSVLITVMPHPHTPTHTTPTPTSPTHTGARIHKHSLSHAQTQALTLTCTYTSTHPHTRIHKNSLSHAQTQALTLTRTYTSTHSHTHMKIHARYTHKHSPLHAHKNAHINSHTYAHIHISTHKHIQTYSETHTLTHVWTIFEWKDLQM